MSLRRCGGKTTFLFLTFMLIHVARATAFDYGNVNNKFHNNENGANTIINKNKKRKMKMANGNENVEVLNTRFGPRIVGGIEASAGEFPWLGAVVSRSLTSEAQQYCGSMLIAPNAVLSAAHCFYIDENRVSPATKIAIELNRFDLRVPIGTGTESNAIRVGINKIVLHPSYNYNTNDNDAAVLILSANVTSVPPAKLPPRSASTDLPPTGYPLIAAGWGDTFSGSDVGSPVMRKVTVPVYSQGMCLQDYGGGIFDNMICAGLVAGGKDGCQGDSGGPLFAEDGVVYGISSFGAGCGDPNAPGVYARVSNPNIWDFIDATVKGVEYVPPKMEDSSDGSQGADSMDNSVAAALHVTSIVGAIALASLCVLF